MKTLKRITAVVICISILYIVSRDFLSGAGLSYRMWVDILGKAVSGLTLPLCILLLVGMWVYKRTGIPTAVKTALAVLAVIGYGSWVCFAGLFMLFTTEEEKPFSKNIIMVNKGGFPKENVWIPYRAVNPFFRTGVDWTDELMEEYLEEKYEKDFEKDTQYGTDSDKTIFYEKENSDVKAAVWTIAGLYGFQITDDYVEGVSLKYLKEGYEALSLERDYYVEEATEGVNGMLYLELKDERDITALAEDTAQLLNYVLEHTDVYEKNLGSVCFFYGEEKTDLDCEIFFGNVSGRTKPYMLPEVIEERIRLQIGKVLSENEQNGEMNTSEPTRAEEPTQSAERTETAEPMQPAEQAEVEEPSQADSREQSAKIIYDAYLASEGYSYEVCYNAKGNLYIDLGSRAAGEPEDKSSTGTYRFTLVYDRLSQNGACDLFVLYKEHYSEGEQGSVNDGTAILNMYAVETATGKAVSGNRQAWADVGTKEYRELTGE